MLYSRDDIELHDDIDAEERATSLDEDRYGWARVDYAATDALQGSTLLAHATLSSDRSGVSNKTGVGSGRLDDRRDFTIDSVQSDWWWRPRVAGKWLVQFGGALDRASGRYDYEDEVAFELLFDAAGAAREPTRARDIELNPRGDHEALYASARFQPAPRLTMDFGLRWDEQTLDPGESGVLGPRVGVRYGFSERTFLRAGWGRFAQSQAINELPVSDGVEQFLPPQRAEHLVLALEHTFPAGINLRVEAYEKEMSHLRPRYESLLHSLTLLPELKPDRVLIVPDAAVARGIELRLEHTAARLGWWAGYSRSEAIDRVAGAEVVRSWDQTHAVAGGLSLQTPKWHLGAAVTYRSGWPTTAALALDDGGPVPTVVTGPRNAERVGAYRSLDLRLTRTFATQRGRIAAFLEVTNAFDYRNRCCTEYQVELDDDETPFLELSAVDYLPLVPSLGFVWSF
jgi:outer membrane receptor protein involved in Fe transport